MCSSTDSQLNLLTVLGAEIHKEKRNFMSKIVVAVCADWPDFIYHFLDYFELNSNSVFDIRGFTSLKSLDEHLSVNKVDILLLSQEIFTYAKNSKEEYLSGNDSGNVREIVLLGGQQDLSKDPKEINIYRSMRQIQNDLELIAWEMGLSLESDFKDGVLINGIYSLVYADPLSWPDYRISGVISEDCLYINLGRLSHLELESNNLPVMANLSDLIFAHMSRDPDFTRLASQAVNPPIYYYPFRFIKGPNSPDDISLLGGYELESLIRKIAVECGYKNVVLGISNSVTDLVEVFGICQKIYMPSVEYDPLNPPSLLLERYLRMRSRTDLLDRFVPDNTDCFNQALQTPEGNQKAKRNGTNRRSKNKAGK